MDDLTPRPAVHPTPDQRRPRVQYAPDLRLTALAGVGALAALILALTAADGPGALLFVIAALILAGYAGSDLLFRPRLAADGTGLLIRSPFARTRLEWSEIEDVRVDERHRLGLRSATLEVDAAAQLIVLSRRALGSDPVTVAATVRALRPRGPAGG